MELGCFSVSLAVKDLAASRAFYEKLGFEAVAGDAEQGWLVLRSGTTNIGLFQGMFERNLLTFNPGWDQAAEALESFEDVRQIRARLEAGGLEVEGSIEAEAGPGHLMLIDPDGNPILIDQHV